MCIYSMAVMQVEFESYAGCVHRSMWWMSAGVLRDVSRVWMSDLKALERSVGMLLLSNIHYTSTAVFALEVLILTQQVKVNENVKWSEIRKTRRWFPSQTTHHYCFSVLLKGEMYKEVEYMTELCYLLILEIWVVILVPFALNNSQTPF